MNLRTQFDLTINTVTTKKHILFLMRLYETQQLKLEIRNQMKNIDSSRKFTVQSCRAVLVSYLLISNFDLILDDDPNRAACIHNISRTSSLLVFTKY